MKTMLVLAFVMFAINCSSKKTETLEPKEITAKLIIQKVSCIDGYVLSPENRCIPEDFYPKNAEEPGTDTEAEEPSRYEEPTQVEIRQAIKNAPDLVERWREYKSADAKALLQEYLLEYQIKPENLGLKKSEVEDLLKDEQD